MYEFISGILESAQNGIAVVDCNGVGYRINVALSSLNRLPAPGKQVKIYTYLQVREDAMELFGFLTSEEKEIFEILISVSGVGARLGLAILSAFSPNELIGAVLSGDAKLISKAPGVGPKLAQRIILELKDKFKGTGTGEIPEAPAEISASSSEAVQALISLGYTASEAQKAVIGLEGDVSEIVGQALRKLMRS